MSQTDQIWETRPGENLGLFMCLNASSESDLLSDTTLISTLDEVMQIQADGRQKRQEAEEELRRMEIELRDKLLQI